MSDTPETDKAEKRYESAKCKNQALDQAFMDMGDIEQRLNQAIKERDEARREAEDHQLMVIIFAQEKGWIFPQPLPWEDQPDGER